MVLSLTFHEFAHALVARWLGDDTAKRAGRLTLNPMVHIDPVGTLLLPAMGALTGVPLIGWAKPCPVDPSRFRAKVDRRRGFALVAAAGPLSNLLLALISAAVIRFGGDALAEHAGLALLFSAMLRMNVGLFVFNLLPIAPLDGSRLTPRSLDRYQRQIAPYSMFVLMGIVMIEPLRSFLIARPVGFVVRCLATIFGLAA